MFVFPYLLFIAFIADSAFYFCLKLDFFLILFMSPLNGKICIKLEDILVLSKKKKKLT